MKRDEPPIKDNEAAMMSSKQDVNLTDDEAVYDQARKKDTTPEDVKDHESTPENQSTLKVGLVMASVFLSMFLVGLDRTIISTVSIELGNE